MKRSVRTRPARQAANQHGFITMIVLLIIIVAVILFVAYKRVLQAQQ